MNNQNRAKVARVMCALAWVFIAVAVTGTVLLLAATGGMP